MSICLFQTGPSLKTLIKCMFQNSKNESHRARMIYDFPKLVQRKKRLNLTIVVTRCLLAHNVAAKRNHSATKIKSNSPGSSRGSSNRRAILLVDWVIVWREETIQWQRNHCSGLVASRNKQSDWKEDLDEEWVLNTKIFHETEKSKINCWTNF